MMWREYPEIQGFLRQGDAWSTLRNKLYLTGQKDQMNTRQTIGEAPGSTGSVGNLGLADDRFSSAAMVN
jgi:hypothetical protein